MPEIKHGGKSAGDIIFCAGNGVRHRKAFCQVGYNRGRQSAAGSVRVRIVDAFSVKPPVSAALLKQQVICIVDAVAALTQNGAMIGF